MGLDPAHMVVIGIAEKFSGAKWWNFFFFFFLLSAHLSYIEGIVNVCQLGDTYEGCSFILANPQAWKDEGVRDD